MGVPTNYNKQEPQIQKRFDSLNDLKYYTIKYNVKINKDYLKSCEFNMEPTVFDIVSETEYGQKCVKKFSSLNDETAERNMISWLEAMKTQNRLTEYIIEEMASTDLIGVLDEKRLLPLFDENLFNEVLEKSKNEV